MRRSDSQAERDDVDLVTALRSADRSAPTRAVRVIGLAELERRWRWRLMRRGVACSVMLGIGLLLQASFARQDLSADPATSIRAAIAELRAEWRAADAEHEASAVVDDSVPSSAGSVHTDLARIAIERCVAASFRAAHRSAAAGDTIGVERLRRLAEDFPTTRAGRCARNFLVSRTTIKDD